MGEIRNFRSGNDEPPSHGPMPRRLAAIIVGDIASYSRLMQADEEGTHVRVKRIERDLIQPSIVEHHGSLVKTTGDGFIAIFDSPVEAVRCSIVIQQNLIGRNASLPKDTRIEYRIGVNLGDVIVEPDDVYGDGVNIATRIEGIAEPGQVFISGAIYEQIKHKVVCGYESLGDRKVKNITDPVRVYSVLPDADAVGRTRGRRENALIFLLGITLLGDCRRRAVVSAGSDAGQGERAGRRDCRFSHLFSQRFSCRITEPAASAARGGVANAAAFSLVGFVISVARSGVNSTGSSHPRTRDGRHSRRRLCDGKQ